MSRLRLKKENELGPHKKDEPGLEGRDRTWNSGLTACLGHPHKDVIRQSETHKEFRIARGSEKDLTVSNLKIIRKIIESLFRYQEEKEGKEGRS